jgi:hypothetical protein
MILLSVFAGGLWIIPLGILLGMVLSFWQAYRQSKGNQFQEKQIYLDNGVKKSRMVDTGKATKPWNFGAFWFGVILAAALIVVVLAMYSDR